MNYYDKIYFEEIMKNFSFLRQIKIKKDEEFLDEIEEYFDEEEEVFQKE